MARPFDLSELQSRAYLRRRRLNAIPKAPRPSRAIVAGSGSSRICPGVSYEIE